MDKQNLKSLALATTLSVGGLFFTGTASADALDQVLKVGQDRSEAAQTSQDKIDKVADQTRELLVDYKTVNKQIDGLKVYNGRLDRQIANQMERIASIEKSISDVTVIQRQILPLAVRMVDGLEQAVNLDMPFHRAERADRLEFLRTNIDRSDLSTAEKFRQVLEAYKIESEYGRRIDTYKDTIQISGGDREVDILRIGRIALLYQTTDSAAYGYWNKEAKEWTALDGGEFRAAITNGIRMANKQASIDILSVPIPAPGV